MAKAKKEHIVRAETYFKNIVNTVREPLIILDEELHVISANEAFYRLFQVSPGETERKHIYELGSGQWKLDGLHDLLVRVIPRNEEFRDYEVDHDFPVIGRRIMLLNGRRIDQDGGGEQLILLAIEDITEQKRKDMVLTDTVKLVENSPDIITRFDLEGRHVYANKVLAKYVGRPDAEIAGKTPAELGFPPSMGEAFSSAFDRVLSTKKGEMIEVPLGDRVNQAFIEPEFDIRGNIVSFAAYSRDITEIKKAEKALRLSEARFRAVFAQSPLSTQIFSPDGRTLEVNHGWEKLWGFDQSTPEYYKEFLAGYNILRDKQLEAKGVMPCIRKGFSGEATEIRVITYDPKEMGISGRARSLRALIYPIKDEAGRILQVVLMHVDLTELMEAEKAMRESEEKYRSLVENATDGIIIVQDGIIKFTNRCMATLDGSTVEDLIGTTYLDHVHPSAIPRMKDIYRRRMAGEKIPTPYETVLRRRNGEVVPSEISAALISYQGKPADLVIIRDISERKRTEEALRGSEQRFRSLIETSPDAITYTDLQGKIIYTNRKTAEMHRYDNVGEIIGKSSFMFIVPEDHARAEQNLKRTLLTGISDNLSYTFLRKDGTRFPAELSATVVRDAHGKPIGFVGISRDISRRKMLEEELQRKEKAFRTLAVNSPDIIIRYGRDGRILYANPKAEPLLGRSPEEIVGKTYAEAGIPEQQAVFWESLVREVFAAKKEKTIGFYFPPGDISYNTHLVPEFDDQGSVVSVLSISRDITGMKKQEETLRRNAYELRTLVDNSPDLIFRMNSSLRYEEVNSAYERLTGIPKERFIGKSNEELGMPSDLVEFWRKSLMKAFESGQEYSVEFGMTGLFGKRYFTTRLIPEFIKSGRVETVLAIARDITERTRAEEQLRYISFHDKVTGIFNRAFFEEELRRLDTERELPISIIMGDINNLKLANDVFGHQEGDRLLTIIAQSIRKACRQNDVIARWGGDEFAVILPRTDLSTAETVCSRVNQIIEQGKETVVQPSIALGIAVKVKKDQNIYQTVRQAEQGMYDNKLANSAQNEKVVLSSLLARARETTRDLTEHVARGYTLARRFGKDLGFDEGQMSALLLLIELHDIGTAVIPGEILTKPGRLTPHEKEIVHRHPEAGYRIVRSFPDTAKIAEEVLAHDERWDGSGYPRGLQGREIPFLARVFALIEAFDVMTHPRRYARTFTREEAIQELRINSGKQFDPELVEAFVKIIGTEAPVIL